MSTYSFRERERERKDKFIYIFSMLNYNLKLSIYIILCYILYFIYRYILGALYEWSPRQWPTFRAGSEYNDVINAYIYIYISL